MDASVPTAIAPTDDAATSSREPSSSETQADTALPSTTEPIGTISGASTSPESDASTSTGGTTSGEVNACTQLPTEPTALERVEPAAGENWASLAMTGTHVMLPDGSVVGSGPEWDTNASRLERTTTDGATRPLLRGVEEPRGMVLGPDGFLYVAESGSGRVLRVNAETGAFTIAALGLDAPHRIAFGPDPAVMYVSSQKNSAIYRVVFGPTGSVGQVSIFARSFNSGVTEPTDQCHGQPGLNCELPNGSDARCKAVGSVVDCFRVNPCQLVQDGTECSFPQKGVCMSQVCVDPCYGSVQGASCDLDFAEGRCLADATGGNLYCAERKPCDDKSVGDACENGVCDDLSSSVGLTCRASHECDALGAGAACTDNFNGAGFCVLQEHSTPYCDPNPCVILEAGDACDSPYSALPGTCTTGGALLDCVVSEPCDGLELGATCSIGETPGACELNQWGGIECRANPCAGEPLWATCGFDGVQFNRCAQGEGGLYCQPGQDTCYGKSDGDACRNVSPGYRQHDGLCRESGDDITCVAVDLCAGHEAGDACATSHGAGRCVEASGTLECALPCEGLGVGDACELPGGPATCQPPADSGVLTCTLSKPCMGRNTGDACDSERGPGTCSYEQDCIPASCTALTDNSKCVLPNGAFGACSSGECTATLGMLGGLAVDGCGNVYASDLETGNLWRISPEGDWVLIAILREYVGAKFDLTWGTDRAATHSLLYAVTDWQLFGANVGIGSSAN